MANFLPHQLKLHNLFKNQFLFINLINISVCSLVSYIIFKYIWMNCFVDLSVKNYFAYYLWCIFDIFSLNNRLEGIFKNINLNFGHMILLNDHPLYWNIELQWILWLINHYEGKEIIIFTTQQLENNILQYINIFFYKIDEMLSFVNILIIFYFYKISINYTYKKMHKNATKIKLSYNFMNMYIHLIVDFFFITMIPLLLTSFIIVVLKNILTYLVIKIYNIKHVIITYRWPKLFLIISELQWNFLTHKKFNDVIEFFIIKFNYELKYFSNNIFKYLSTKIIEILQLRKQIIKHLNTKMLIIGEIKRTKRTTIFYFYVWIKSAVFFNLNLIQYVFNVSFLVIKNIVFSKILNNLKTLIFLKNFISFYKSKFSFWRPLFKRWSYLGFFFKTRTPWVRFHQTNELTKK